MCGESPGLGFVIKLELKASERRSERAVTMMLFVCVSHGHLLSFSAVVVSPIRRTNEQVTRITWRRRRGSGTQDSTLAGQH